MGEYNIYAGLPYIRYGIHIRSRSGIVHMKAGRHSLVLMMMLPDMRRKTWPN